MTTANGLLQLPNQERTSWVQVYTADTISADTTIPLYNPRALGAIVSIKTTNRLSSGSFTPKIRSVDTSGATLDLWAASAAVATNTTSTYVFYPGGAATMTATQITDMPLPSEWSLFLDFTAGSFDLDIAVAYI